MLSAYTPRGLYYALKESGYEIKPLKGKITEIFHLKRAEDTGKLRGDGLLMYHL